MSVCSEVCVFLTDMSEKIGTLEGVFVAENANAKESNLQTFVHFCFVVMCIHICYINQRNKISFIHMSDIVWIYAMSYLSS